MLRQRILFMGRGFPFYVPNRQISQIQLHQATPLLNKQPLVCTNKRWTSNESRPWGKHTLQAILPKGNADSEDVDKDENTESDIEGQGGRDDVDEDETSLHDKIKLAVMKGNLTPEDAYYEHMKVFLGYNDQDYRSKLTGAPLPDFMARHGSVLNMIRVEDMVNAGVHYGHHRSFWNPAMEPYIYGTREDVHIFDLEQTAAHLRRALDVLRNIAYRGGMILFVGNRKQFEKEIRYAALSCGEFYVTEKWMAGCLSNRRHMLRSNVLPDFAVFMTLPVSKGALRECTLMNIPSMAIVDSDQNPFSVTYPIPGNDDTDSAIKYYCNLMEKAIVEGKYCRANLLNLVDASASPGGRLGAIAPEEESAHK